MNPDKRDEGPINEANIGSVCRFVFKLLKLLTVEIVSGSTVEVRWLSLTNAGRSCGARAVVRNTGKIREAIQRGDLGAQGLLRMGSLDRCPLDLGRC